MDKITLPLTKDVDQKVIGSVIEEPTKGMLVGIPTVVILMLLFIPDESSKRKIMEILHRLLVCQVAPKIVD